MLHIVALALALMTPNKPHRLPAITVAAHVQCDGAPRIHIKDPFSRRSLYYCYIAK